MFSLHSRTAGGPGACAVGGPEGQGGPLPFPLLAGFGIYKVMSFCSFGNFSPGEINLGATPPPPPTCVALWPRHVLDMYNNVMVTEPPLARGVYRLTYHGPAPNHARSAGARCTAGILQPCMGAQRDSRGTKGCAHYTSAPVRVLHAVWASSPELNPPQCGLTVFVRRSWGRGLPGLLVVLRVLGVLPEEPRPTHSSHQHQREPTPRDTVESLRGA